MEGPQKQLRPGEKWGASQEGGMRQTQAAGAEKKSDTTTPCFRMVSPVLWLSP